MNTTFYEKGLRFTCTRCSRCCRHEPGFVFLSYEDLDRLILHFRMPVSSFLDRFCRTVDLGLVKRLSLQEKDNYDCILWGEGGCIAYEARPLQCRSYPFWAPHLESIDTWRALTADCPGIDRGELHSRETIEQWLFQRRKERFIDMDKDDLSWLRGAGSDDEEGR